MVRISEVSTHWMEYGVPQVAVSGAWLRDFGFDVGGKVVVEVVKGQIIIKSVDSED
jgi:hypothetical protein